MSEEDKLGIGWMVLSFLFPIAGIIIFFVQRSKGYPNKAKTAIMVAFAAIAVNIVFVLMSGGLAF